MRLETWIVCYKCGAEPRNAGRLASVVAAADDIVSLGVNQETLNALIGALAVLHGTPLPPPDNSEDGWVAP